MLPVGLSCLCVWNQFIILSVGWLCEGCTDHTYIENRTTGRSGTIHASAHPTAAAVAIIIVIPDRHVRRQMDASDLDAMSDMAPLCGRPTDTGLALPVRAAYFSSYLALICVRILAGDDRSVTRLRGNIQSRRSINDHHRQSQK